MVTPLPIPIPIPPITKARSEEEKSLNNGDISGLIIVLMFFFTALALPAGRLIDEVQLVHTVQGK